MNKETLQLGTLASLKILMKLENLDIDLTPVLNKLLELENKINQIPTTDLTGLINQLDRIEAKIDNDTPDSSTQPTNEEILTAGTILALLGTLTDQSGYSSAVIPTQNQSNPTQITGIDGKPALALITNQTELSVSNIPSLLTSSAGATLYAVYSSSNPVQNLIQTNNSDQWWRFVDGNGYLSVFRGSRLEGYPANMPTSGNNLISIHSRSNDYEVFVNNTSRGVVSGNWANGDRFLISPIGKQNTCNLSLLLVVPFWADKASLFHAQKLQAIKSRFPSLPFSL